MKLFRNFVIFYALFSMSCTVSFALQDYWKNDLRTMFLNNDSLIKEINIRSFNSKDYDNDGFIQEDKGEIRGTFLNAIERLDELKNLGINTLHILPITPVGKLKALGTAGSLYAAADFDSLNPELIDKNSDLTPEQQAKLFIKEAHKRNIRVIVDIPACASYDLFLERPDLFVTNSNGEPIIPADWTDVRLLNAGTDDKIETNVYSLYKDFVKYMLSLGVDGIRADVAHSKPASFWKELIEYSRTKDPEFLWLAESSESWHSAISPQAVFTPYDKLLDAGFDGYYGSFFDIKDWKSSKQLYKTIETTLANLKKFKDKKAVIGSFTTHDEVSPIILKGKNLSERIIWMSATLPINSYFVDGFQTGDDYLYKNGNKLAPSSYTDDDTYFSHRGKIDIFNLSRKPGGKYNELKNDFLLGNDVKNSLLPLLNEGVFTPLKTSNNKVFAYKFENNIKKVITIGNLDYEKSMNVSVRVPKFNPKRQNLLPIKITKMPEVKRGKLILDLNPGETVVIIIHELL
ncbi:MAG: hypothetical protein E7Z87_08005 [Cyanobacteria bacterium SIG26]|nr:hypothetical protein [Cyanobacteria bacterium SIG26]